MVKVSAIILAAGLSRRMATMEMATMEMGRENKLFLEFKGKALVEWVIDQVTASKVDEIIIVTSELSNDKLIAFASDKIKVVNNPDYKIGMTTSIQKGVASTSEECNGYMICLGDQPLIETSDYNTIIASFKDSQQKNSKIITVPFYEGKKGNPVIFSSFYKEQILVHQEPEGCKEIIQKNKNELNKINLNSPFILQDIDTKEEYDKLIKKSSKNL